MKTIAPSTRRSTPNVSHTFLTNLKATGEVQRVPVGESLYLQISAKGKKTWYLRYDTLTPDGKRKQNIVSLGQFPKMGIKEARAEAEARRDLSKEENANLVQVRKEELIRKAQASVVHTFQNVAESWLDLKMAEWEGRSGKQNRGRLAANVYPVIGDLSIDKITVNDIEHALKHVISRGSLEVARRVHTLIVSVFKYALAMRKLAKISMRYAPKRILVGEVRDAAALEMLKLWNTGHPGGVSTFHADSAEEALPRLEELVEEAGLGPKQKLIGRAVDLAMYMEKTPDNKRRISSIVKVNRFNNKEDCYETETLYTVTEQGGQKIV